MLSQVGRESLTGCSRHMRRCWVRRDVPERVWAGVAAECRVVVPVPIVVQPGLELEPLTRKALVLDERPRDRRHGAEGLVGGRPHHAARRVGHQLGPLQVVGMHVVERRAGSIGRAVQHRHRLIARPDVLLDHVPRPVGLGQQVVPGVVEHLRGAGRAHVEGPAHRQAVLGVVGVVGRDRRADRELRDPSRVADGVAVDRPRAVVRDGVRRKPFCAQLWTPIRGRL